MESVNHLVVGAGVSGLSFAAAVRAEAAARGKPAPDLQVVEADGSPGGYCKTVRQDGFTWDYSGHFFHFKHPEIEQWLLARMPAGQVRTVQKRAFVRYAGQDVDFPFQKNIHQLPRQDFVDCLVDLYFSNQASHPPPANLKEMLVQRFGSGIAERFLIPYNEKLYACDLGTLDVEAMGRFFPHADVADIIRNMRTPDNSSYNATFTYPRGGAIEYVNALLSEVPEGAVRYGERLVEVDLARRLARTSRRTIRYEKLVSSAPLDRLAAACGLDHDRGAFSYNRVLVFNLGFDRKGPEGVHWIYFPDRERCFYRVGFYDNIHGDSRMSLYVEIGAPGGDRAFDVDRLRERVLADLAAEGITRGHELVSWHHVVLDPAYVHITRRSLAEVKRLMPILAAGGVHPVGRYGGWTYCSIEDNIVETRALARVLVEVL
jgi:protoporphyrinogen oxidase